MSSEASDIVAASASPIVCRHHPSAPGRAARSDV